MSKSKIQERIKVKPFVKYVNLNHVMPTRLIIASELELDGYVKTIEKSASEVEGDGDIICNPDFRATLVKKLKKGFETTYAGVELNNTADESNNKLKFFFKKLRF